ncbi:replication initiator protein A [Oscillospiraceae bacterium 38-13]
MPDMKLPSYFYGDEAMQFTYFRIPCQLITHPRFKHLSTDSKLLYGMLLDRMSLSIKNEWYDDTGRVYIYYTVDEVCNNLNCGRDKAMRLLAELDTGKGVGLIERKKQGQGMRTTPPCSTPSCSSWATPFPKRNRRRTRKKKRSPALHKRNPRQSAGVA